MGHGIAQTAAANGIQVVAVETNPDPLARGIGMIDASLKVAGSAVKKGKMTQEEADHVAAETSGRITGTTDMEQLADCDLIIEAIIEDYSIKNPMWENLGKICQPNTIFASNTSSLSITQQVPHPSSSSILFRRNSVASRDYTVSHKLPATHHLHARLWHLVALKTSAGSTTSTLCK